MTLLLSEKKQPDDDTQYAGLHQHSEENNAASFPYGMWLNRKVWQETASR